MAILLSFFFCSSKVRATDMVPKKKNIAKQKQKTKNHTVSQKCSGAWQRHPFWKNTKRIFVSTTQITKR
jgi:hypothetical protein